MRAREPRGVDRRSALKVLAGAALGWTALPWAPIGRSLQAGEKDKKRVLMFTRCQGYEHSVVRRKNGDLAYCEKILVEWGEKNGFEVTATKDGRLFTEGNIAHYDAFIFYTSGMLTEKGGDNQPPMPAEGKTALLEAIAAGKGFVGIHSAHDSFHSKGPGDENQPEEKRDPYIRMIGGEFVVHGEQQEAEMKILSPEFPSVKGLKDFRLLEEWYAHKNFAPDLHVVLAMETKGMKGPMYQRPLMPSTWARKHQKGRVFYTSMGHREDIWLNESFKKILLGGIAWTLGDVDADVTANMAKVTPGATELPGKPVEKK